MQRFSVMLDVSRNGVMKVEKVKEFVDYVKLFGYNSLMLYTEDTYEIEGEPYFGYLRGRYSKEELKETGFSDEELGTWTIKVQKVITQDWSQKWKEHWKPTQASEHVVICPSWENYTKKQDFYF